MSLAYKDSAASGSANSDQSIPHNLKDLLISVGTNIERIPNFPVAPSHMIAHYLWTPTSMKIQSKGQNNLRMWSNQSVTVDYYPIFELPRRLDPIYMDRGDVTYEACLEKSLIHESIIQISRTRIAAQCNDINSDERLEAFSNLWFLAFLMSGNMKLAAEPFSLSIPSRGKELFRQHNKFRNFNRTVPIANNINKINQARHGEYAALENGEVRVTFRTQTQPKKSYSMGWHLHTNRLRPINPRSQRLFEGDLTLNEATIPLFEAARRLDPNFIGLHTKGKYKSENPIPELKRIRRLLTKMYFNGYFAHHEAKLIEKRAGHTALCLLFGDYKIENPKALSIPKGSVLIVQTPSDSGILDEARNN